jgi:hypothetical protein
MMIMSITVTILKMPITTAAAVTTKKLKPLAESQTFLATTDLVSKLITINIFVFIMQSLSSRLGGGTGPKVRGFKLGRGDGFLTAREVRSTSPFRGEVKPEAPCCKILQHVKNHLQV